MYPSSQPSAQNCACFITIKIFFDQINRSKDQQAQICAEGCEEEYITHIFQI